MAGYVKRDLLSSITKSLNNYPVTALLGPRQAGKSTLAKRIIQKKPKAIYLDLERPSHLNKLEDPEYFFTHNSSSLICLDEVQRTPNIFPLIRSIVDERKRNGQFLILGSAGKDLLKQTSESLTGRISYLELTPFLLSELPKQQKKLWIRGGLAKSFLSKNISISVEWRENYIRNFLERDIPQFGLRVPAVSVGRLWRMLAHSHGQTLNLSQLASSLGVSVHTVRSYIDILEKTFLIRQLQPFATNLKKRYIKAPKVYVRDSGILHALLRVHSLNNLLGRPEFGSSYEGFVIENIISVASLLAHWEFYFYRTRSGAEVDLLMVKDRQRIAIEIKANTAPKVKSGFWSAVQDVKATKKYLIAPVESPYRIKGDVVVTNLFNFIRKINKL